VEREEHRVLPLQERMEILPVLTVVVRLHVYCLVQCLNMTSPKTDVGLTFDIRLVKLRNESTSKERAQIKSNRLTLRIGIIRLSVCEAGSHYQVEKIVT
jgi:hypothetical protein